MSGSSTLARLLKLLEHSLEFCQDVVAFTGCSCAIARALQMVRLIVSFLVSYFLVCVALCAGGDTSSRFGGLQDVIFCWPAPSLWGLLVMKFRYSLRAAKLAFLLAL